MIDNNVGRPSYLAADEKITPIMVYTQNTLIRGGIITKENIRVGIWMRMSGGVPEFLRLKNANVLVFGPSLHSQSYVDYFLPTPQIVALHLIPPASEPLDYDESEPNRKMEALTVLVGSFRFNSHVRMSTQSDIATFISISRNPWMSLYDVEITNPNLQAMGVLRIPFVLVRHAQVTFGTNA